MFMDDYKRELAQTLVVVRLGAGLSQAEVARRMGVTSPAVSNVVNGHAWPGMQWLWRYADACGVDVRDLIPSSIVAD